LFRRPPASTSLTPPSGWTPTILGVGYAWLSGIAWASEMLAFGLLVDHTQPYRRTDHGSISNMYTVAQVARAALGQIQKA
jgi:hypothetical protein